MLIGLAKLSPILSLSMSNPKAASTGSRQAKQAKGTSEARKVIAAAPRADLSFSDSEPSDESSRSSDEE